MVEHRICKGCQWNKYPLCEGTKMDSGNFMNIENLRIGFKCDQKNDLIITNFNIIKKSESELKIKDLETRITELEIRR